MIKKLLVMGKHTIEKNQWGPIREFLGMNPDDKTKIEIINVPVYHVLTHEEVKQYSLVLSTQTNPIILRRVNEILKKANVTLIKPFRNNEGVITHFMKINDVIVDYKYDLVKLNVSENKVQETKKPFNRTNNTKNFTRKKSN